MIVSSYTLLVLIMKNQVGQRIGNLAITYLTIVIPTLPPMVPMLYYQIS